MATVRSEERGEAVWLWLQRPSVKNAFNDELLADLRRAVAGLSERTRVLVLAGEGPVFCAGADLGWMQKSRQSSAQENAADAAKLAALFGALDEAPQVVIARVHGAALGGGLGLVACADIAVASDDAKLGLTEVRLGLVPAVISPFVVRKIGESAARRYFVTGEIFTAATALGMGLVHEVVPAPALDQAIERLCAAVLANGPAAVRQAKALAREMGRVPLSQALHAAVEVISRVRASPEGQEGMAAFLDKRPPKWPA